MKVHLSKRLIQFFVTLFALSAIALPGPRDGTGTPQTVIPLDVVITSGDTDTVQVTLNQAATENQVVYLSSSSPDLVVPSSVTIQAGSSTGYAVAASDPDADDQDVTVTATCNGVSAMGRVTISAE